MVDEVVAFLGASPCFHIATVDADAHPRNRPFSLAFEHNGHLFSGTNTGKKVYAELAKNPFVEISSFNPTTGDWARIHGKAIFVEDQAGKEKVFVVAPYLKDMYGGAENPTVKIFYIEGQADFYKFGPDPGPFKTIRLE
jgi:uncharacterized pyridoxamine 5'-phosphate oxidase family protein